MRIFPLFICAVFLLLFLTLAASHAAPSPSRSSTRWTVIIDPGHGGLDPGTWHNGVLERRMTLELSKRLQKELRRRGVRVKMTRTGNATLTVDQRAHFAGKNGGKLLVSMHVNAHAHSRIRGVEVWHWRKKGAKIAVPGQRLAQAVHRGIAREMRKKGLRWRDGGIKSENFGILRVTSIPAVIVESGYATNPADARLLRRRDYQNALSKGIADGVIAYLRTLRKG